MKLLLLLFCFASLIPSRGLAADPNDGLTPVKPNFAPGPEYGDATRIFQGIPGLERAANGRLWALWYAGGPDEPSEGPGNYVVLVTSADDGKTWSGPKLVIDPPGEVRAYDPCLWHDPRGRLWLFWAQSSNWWDGRSGTWAMVSENPGEETPKWSEPRRLANGIMMNKPTVLGSGEWLLPVSVWAQAATGRTKPEYRHDLGKESGANVVVSRDEGKTFSLVGQATMENRIFDEHMLVERKDGGLWMLMRTKKGIAESFSQDKGKTWSPGLPSAIPHIDARFFIRRLKSGRLLLVRHNPPDLKTRSHLTAWLSDDDGKTWHGGLMIDERKGVSYPDGVEDDRGVIRLIYDYARVAEKQIFMAVFTEKDVAAGKPSGTTRLQVPVNQATGVNPKQKKAVAGAKHDHPVANVIIPPLPEQADTVRTWQGIPGIERAAKGRLWSTWYSGDIGEGGMGNYAVVATSGNDGKNWEKPSLVIEGPKGTRIGDPLPWIDPKGRLWVFYAQFSAKKDAPGATAKRGTFAIRTDEPDKGTPVWTAPLLIAEGGILFGKPVVLPDGSWLAPFFVNGNPPAPEVTGGKETGTLLSKDQGASWQWQGGTSIAPELRNFSEATLASRRDGSLLMVIRTQKGLYESTSRDSGRTWTDAAPMPGFAGPATRACLLKLKSGAFVLIYHEPVKSETGSYRRSKLTAWLSDDEGRTWPHRLLVDERDRVSYPDAVQAPDGRLYITYDLGRYEPGDKAIIVSIVREEDIRAGKIISTDARTKLVVNRAYGYGNHPEIEGEAKVAQAMPGKENLHVYLLIGQSNMAGRGALPVEDRLSRTRVLKFSARNAWAPGVEPLHTDKPAVAGAGLGMSFAREMAAADPKVTIGLVPCAVGGTPLERWMKGGDLYEAALVRARLALKDGTLKGILWHQGEGDSNKEDTARSYGERLGKMIADLRADLGAGEVPFVAGKLGEFLALQNKDGRPSFWPVVNEQIKALSTSVPKYAVAESTDLKHRGDVVHFDTPSLREFGRRYAEAMKQLQAK